MHLFLFIALVLMVVGATVDGLATTFFAKKRPAAKRGPNERRQRPPSEAEMLSEWRRTRTQPWPDLR